MKPVSKELRAPSPKLSRLLCHDRPILKIPRKLIHPFYCNVANRHAKGTVWDTVKQYNLAWNCLADNFFCRARHFVKNSMIIRSTQICFRLFLVSCWAFAENFMMTISSFYPQLCLQTRMSLSVEKYTVTKGLFVTLPKFSRYFLITFQICPENFIKIRSSVSRNDVERQTGK